MRNTLLENENKASDCYRLKSANQVRCYKTGEAGCTCFTQSSRFSSLPPLVAHPAKIYAPYEKSAGQNGAIAHF